MAETGSSDNSTPQECSQGNLFYTNCQEATGTRGTCLILNNTRYPVRERLGTEHDCRSVQDLFGRILGYDVITHHDLTSKQMPEVLKTCSEDIKTDFSSDSFVCFVLSHGDDGDIQLCDGYIKVRTIISYFTNEACPSLAGKPRFFFFQACRGKQVDKVSVQPDNTHSPEEESKTLHVPDDFFVFYSTSRGHFAFRNPEHGTYFIQTICQVVEKYHCSMSHYAMITLCKEYVGRQEIPTKEHGLVKQMPHVVSTLTRNFRFTPKPLPLHVVVPPTSKGNPYQLKSELFENRFWKEFEGLPVVVISMTGVVRAGTSFILNHMIRYLEHLESHVSSGTERVNWMCHPKKPLEGFSWRFGRTPHTRGIFLFERIFKVKSSSGTVAVVLMDTEGSSKENLEASSVLFTFSMLLSSALIYNVPNDIFQTGVENLQFCANYASLVKKSLENCEDNLSSGESQKLLFLIRDWIYKDEIPYGLDAERKVIDQWLRNDNGADETVKMWMNVRENIKNIDCFLMPSPGEVIKSADFNGRTKDLPEDFKKNMDALCSHVFDANKLVPRSINGRPFTFKDFTVLFKTYFRMAKEGKLPPVTSVYSATMFLHNIRVLQGIQKSYQSGLEQELSSIMRIERLEERLNAVHNQLKHRNMSQVQVVPTKLVGDNTDAFYDQLSQMMDTSFRAISSAVLETQEIARRSDKCKEDFEAERKEAEALDAQLDNIAGDYERDMSLKLEEIKKSSRPVDDVKAEHMNLKQEALSKVPKTPMKWKDEEYFKDMLSSKIDYSYASLVEPVLTKILDAEIKELEAQRDQLADPTKVQEMLKMNKAIEEKKQTWTEVIEEMQERCEHFADRIRNLKQERKERFEMMKARFEKNEEDQKKQERQSAKSAEQYRTEMERIYIEFMKRHEVDLDEVDKQKLADDLISDDSFLSKTLGTFMALYKKTEPNASRNP